MNPSYNHATILRASHHSHVTPSKTVLHPLLLKIRLHTSVLYTVDSELENKAGALNFHVQLEIEIVKFNTLRRGQTSEKAPRNRIQVRGEFADID